MLKKILMKSFFSVLVLGGSFFMLGMGSQYSYAIEGGFGDTSWVGSEAGGEEIRVHGSKDKTDESLINTIKTFINWLLGLLALIALIILLWGGFQMLLAAGDEGKFKKGFTILKQAAVALAFIGLSWLIVSFIFWIIGEVGTGTVGNP